MTHHTILAVTSQDLIVGAVMLLAYSFFLLYAAKGRGTFPRALAFALALVSLVAAGVIFVPALMYGLHP